MSATPIIPVLQQSGVFVTQAVGLMWSCSIVVWSAILCGITWVPVAYFGPSVLAWLASSVWFGVSYFCGSFVWAVDNPREALGGVSKEVRQRYHRLRQHFRLPQTLGEWTLVLSAVSAVAALVYHYRKQQKRLLEHDNGHNRRAVRKLREKLQKRKASLLATLGSFCFAGINFTECGADLAVVVRAFLDSVKEAETAMRFTAHASEAMSFVSDILDDDLGEDVDILKPDADDDRVPPVVVNITVPPLGSVGSPPVQVDDVSSSSSEHERALPESPSPEGVPFWRRMWPWSDRMSPQLERIERLHSAGRLAGSRESRFGLGFLSRPSPPSALRNFFQSCVGLLEYPKSWLLKLWYGATHPIVVISDACDSISYWWNRRSAATQVAILGASALAVYGIYDYFRGDRLRTLFKPTGDYYRYLGKRWRATLSKVQKTPEMAEAEGLLPVVYTTAGGESFEAYVEADGLPSKRSGKVGKRIAYRKMAATHHAKGNDPVYVSKHDKQSRDDNVNWRGKDKPPRRQQTKEEEEHEYRHKHVFAPKDFYMTKKKAERFLPEHVRQGHAVMTPLVSYELRCVHRSSPDPLVPFKLDSYVNITCFADRLCPPRHGFSGFKHVFIKVNGVEYPLDMKCTVFKTTPDLTMTMKPVGCKIKSNKAHFRAPIKDELLVLNFIGRTGPQQCVGKCGETRNFGKNGEIVLTEFDGSSLSGACGAFYKAASDGAVVGVHGVGNSSGSVKPMFYPLSVGFGEELSKIAQQTPSTDLVEDVNYHDQLVESLNFDFVAKKPKSGSTMTLEEAIKVNLCETFIASGDDLALLNDCLSPAVKAKLVKNRFPGAGITPAEWEEIAIKVRGIPKPWAKAVSDRCMLMAQVARNRQAECELPVSSMMVGAARVSVDDLADSDYDSDVDLTIGCDKLPKLKPVPTSNRYEALSEEKESESDDSASDVDSDFQ